MVRVIKELRPTWIVGENVAGIVRMALPDILSELEACGYRTRTFLVPACAVGARHRRYRVAIVGHSERNGSSSSEISGGTQKAGGREQEREKTASEFTGAGKSGNGKTLADTYEEWKLQPTGCKQDIRNGIGLSSEDVQHSNSSGRKEQYATTKSDKEGIIGRGCNAGNVCNATSQRLSDRTEEPMGGQRTQEQESERSMRRTVESVLGGVADGVSDWLDEDLDFLINHYWDKEPDIPRIATGIEHRIDRLKCLGNAVVPQQFYPIFKSIADVERMNYGEKK